MDHESYFNLCCEQSRIKGKVLALRQGGGHDLGLVDGTPSDFPDIRPRRFLLFGAPRHWDDADVSLFLENQNWSKLEVLSRRQRGRGVGPEWLFKAFPPETQSGQSSWSYQDATDQANVFYLNITPEGPRKRKVALSEFIEGPKKSWNSKKLKQGHESIDLTLDVAPTQIDSSQTQNGDAEQARERSPRRDTKDRDGSSRPAILDPDEHLRQVHPHWTIVDKNGNGDCAFCAIAHSLASLQNISDEKIATEAARLRLTAISHLEKHSDIFEHFWSHDDLETKDQRGGADAPSFFKEYLRIAAKQKFYCDEILLAGLARRLGTCIIVLKWDPTNKIWLRSLLAANIKNGVAKIDDASKGVLALKEDHYRALCPKESSRCSALLACRNKATGAWFSARRGWQQK